MSVASESAGQATPTREENPIKLIDRTDPVEAQAPGELQYSSTRSSTYSIPLSKGLSKRITNPSIRGELNRRKYAKWQNEENAKRSKKFRRKRGQGDMTTANNNADEVAEFDILYENQRGWFLFGMPLFSQNSLLNFDPTSWQNAHFKPSPVNITNAQVPDPSWEWAWKTWYVDMSHDVDEEGWEYSFSFQKKFSWHGTHPWFHSFVRRRRWLRKRVKRDPHHLHTHKTEQDKLHEAHKLNADYFTIHTRRRSVGSEDSTSVDMSATLPAVRDDRDRRIELVDIQDIPTLMTYLRKSTIDREKLVGMNQFLDIGGQELYYLADKVPEIMSLLIYQTSRQQLLENLLERIDSAKSHRDEHNTSGKPEGDSERRKIDGMVAAAEVAERQVKRLEYWSDLRDMAREGKLDAATDDSRGWGQEWTGLDTSGPDSRVTLTSNHLAGSSTDNTFSTAEESIRTKTTHSSEITDVTNGLSRKNTETIKEEPAKEEPENEEPEKEEKELP